MLDILIVLFFSHFVCDWLFQSEREALNKSSSIGWLLRHASTYAGLMTLVTYVIWPMLLWQQLVAYFLVTFILHAAVDTYIPVYLWAKYVRRVKLVREKGKAGFKEWFFTPTGAVIAITVDQIFHLLTLTLNMLMILFWIL